MKIREVLEDIENKTITEDLALVRFKYVNFKNDPKPKVKVLDFEYPGQPGQKTYGKRRDLLGWNLNYFSNSREASKAIDQIESFVKLLDGDQKEKYERVKKFYPEQAKYIRRYMRKHVNNLRHRKGLFWSKANYDDLIKFNKEAY